MKKVFLSSTSRDLASYRQAVYDAVEGLEGYHCIRMENFGSRDSSAIEFDAKKVEECDLFVGIIGFLHGNTPQESKKSFTELEYDAAIALGRPILMFLSLINTSAEAQLNESLDKKSQQEKFRQHIAQNRVISTFKSPLDLAAKVVTAIFNWEYETLSQLSEDSRSGRWAHIPQLPRPHLAHPYPLQDHFTGRQNERQMLSNWFLQDQRAMLVLEGLGGLGKSALTWTWLHEDILRVKKVLLNSADFNIKAKINKRL